MKRTLKSFLLIFIIIFSFNIVFAASKVIQEVAVTDIDAPYSNERYLDTEAKVPKNALYRVINVAWKAPSVSTTGNYEVTVTLKANKGYIFSEDTIGTVNSKEIISKSLINDEELNITYAFIEEKDSIGNSTSTLRHRIITSCDEEKGSITPYIVRVLHGGEETIKIEPKEGYKIKDVMVDGESVGAINEYTFRKVKENHTIRAYFEKIEENSNETNSEDLEKTKPILTLLINLLKIFQI